MEKEQLLGFVMIYCINGFNADFSFTINFSMSRGSIYRCLDAYWGKYHQKTLLSF